MKKENVKDSDLINSFEAKLLALFKKHLIPPMENKQQLTEAIGNLKKEVETLMVKLSEFKKLKSETIPYNHLESFFKQYPSAFLFCDIIKTFERSEKISTTEARDYVIFTRALSTFWLELRNYIPQNNRNSNTRDRIKFDPEQKRKNEEYMFNLISIYFKDELKKYDVKFDITNFIMFLCGIYPYNENIKIRKYSKSNKPIMLFGETGTGKELHAKAIHYLSDRSEKPFIPINCGALNEETLLSELFGHVKGAFTGAIKDKKGAIELADGGTLFLDEIGDMPTKAQVSLLRFLNNGKYQRVGEAGDDKSADVRIITATNKDLEVEMKNGKFREDLYHRLCVFPSSIDPLRKVRNEDFYSILFNKFLKIIFDNWRDLKPYYAKNRSFPYKKVSLLSPKIENLNFGTETGVSLFVKYGFLPEIVEHYLYPSYEDLLTLFTKEALDALINYNYPGNYRELENILEHAYFNSDEIIELKDLRKEVREYKNELPSGSPIQDTLNLPYVDFVNKIDELHKVKIDQIIKSNDGKISKAAIKAGLPYYQFRSIVNRGIKHRLGLNRSAESKTGRKTSERNILKE